MKTFLQKNTGFLFYQILLAFALLSGIGATLGAGLFTPTKALLSAGILLFLTLTASFGSRGRMICGGIAILGFLGLILYIGPASLLPFTKEYYVWLFGTPTENMHWLRIYEFLQTCWLTTVSFCLEYAARRWSPLHILIATTGLGWVLLDMLTDQNLSHLCVVWCLSYVLVTCVFYIHRRNQQTFLWLLPYLLVFTILLGITPAPDKPYDWAFFKGAYEGLRETFLILTHSWNVGTQEDFDSTGIGFFTDGTLTGTPLDEEQELLEFQTVIGQKTNLYLTGRIYDSFWGSHWTQENTSTTDDRTLDTLETIYAVWRYDKENMDDYIQPFSMNYKYKLFHTGYLFAPLKSWNLTGGKADYTIEGGNLLLKKRAHYGVSYAAQTLQLNLQNPLFDKLLEAPLQAEETLWAEVQSRYHKNHKPYSLADLEAYHAEIHTYYTAAPQLSEPVQEWLEAALGDAATDLEKLRALETALSQLTYTRSPDGLPAHVTSAETFLDYFLLEGKQGYCSYFATVFVLLARAEGIPARYVEGFCVPVKENTKITVTSDMAHAWPEVYIDEVGWIPFEPTPGYQTIRYTPWQVKAQPTAAPTKTAAPATPTPTIIPTPVPALTPAPVTTPVPITDTPSLSQPIWTALWSIMIICTVVIFFLTIRFLRRRSYARSPLPRKFETMVQKNLYLLQLLGCRRASNETLQEFQERAAALTCPLQFLSLYEAVLYGKHPVTEDTLEITCREQEELLKHLKNTKKLLYFGIKILE